MNTNNRIFVAPSLLSANFGNLSHAVKLIESSKADWVHLDVMDGTFVPNITFGPKMVSDLRELTPLPFDVHLMIVHPENYIKAFADAGADVITVHVEATVHIHRVITLIKEMGKKAGISIVPSSSVSLISEILPFVDLVLVMTVNPGFGGQSLIHECLKKVRHLKKIKEQSAYEYLIEVDGGINACTRDLVIDAGAEVLVTGSAFFRADNQQREVQLLKNWVSPKASPKASP